MENLENLIKDVRPGNGMQALNLLVVPLWHAIPKVDLGYELAADAVRHQHLVITEVDGGEDKSELCVSSRVDRPILLLDGEELVGGMQNRIVDGDVFVEPRGQLTIPVRCVEEGRWEPSEPIFETGTFGPPTLRQLKHITPGPGSAISLLPRTDQRALWHEVKGLLKETGIKSLTGALSAVFSEGRDVLNAYVARLPYPTGATGVAALINGQFVALDHFDHPDTLRRLWPRWIEGMAAQAGSRSTHSCSSGVAVIVEIVLRQLRQCKCSITPGLSLGEHWQVGTVDVVGSALVYAGSVLHLSVFPRRA